MMEQRACYRKGGRRKPEPIWDEQQEYRGLYNKRAKQFGAFQALRGYEEMLAEVRNKVDGAAEPLDK